MDDLSAQLFESVAKGDVPECLNLIGCGANVDTVNNIGWPMLYLAIGCGHIDVCRTLLEHGANANAVDREGSNALYWAADCGNADACLILLEHGADFKVKNSGGQTALSIAIKRKQNNCVSAIQSWIAANAARTALQEITQHAVKPRPSA